MQHDVGHHDTYQANEKERKRERGGVRSRAKDEREREWAQWKQRQKAVNEAREMI